jgi:hypothetical protein
LCYNRGREEVLEGYRRREEMIYKLYPIRSSEIKNKIEADSKQAAVRYFTAIMCLRKRDLLKIYRVAR